MTSARIRPTQLYAWHGQSLLVVDERGDCGAGESLSGYYFRETRYLRTLRLEIDGVPPWLTEATAVGPAALAFTYMHPELTEFGGGGSGEAQGEVTTDDHGVPHRALDIVLRYDVGIASLSVAVALANRSDRDVDIDVAWVVEADFADIQEAQGGKRQQIGDVDAAPAESTLTFTYGHPRLPYRTVLRAGGETAWTASPTWLRTRLHLKQQQTANLALTVEPIDYDSPLDEAGVQAREQRWREWRERLTRVSTPGNLVAEEIIRRNVDDFASYPLLQGDPEEWLAMQAGMPVYPALFGRDTLTAGWQAACLDGGAVIEASLTRLGRLQSARVDDWSDEEPGRIPYQVRQGPLARLAINPYSAYYADFASPLMFVIALAHLYAWTGKKATVARHWDRARRVLDWARDYGDRDRDGYLEYLTRSSEGTKNQGWKDSGRAILYEDGTAVPSPIATCELQGYWFAAQQLMAVLSAVMGNMTDAKAHWAAAMALKDRFNRDWWLDDDAFLALALDPDKRRVRAASSNAGHCLATGIISDGHLPAVVGRLFAPDMFSGWGIRTLSSAHVAYNPLSYHLGSVWAVEQATTAFGLRRFGFEARALDLTRALFDLAGLYPGARIPECVGGYARAEQATPGAYPRANTPQLWNNSAFPLLVHTVLALQPVAALDLLVVDPVLPTWLPELVLHDLRLGETTATLRFWRDGRGISHGEVVRKRGALHLVKQPPIESLSAGLGDRFRALVDTILHH